MFSDHYFAAAKTTDRDLVTVENESENAIDPDVLAVDQPSKYSLDAHEAEENENAPSRNAPGMFKSHKQNSSVLTSHTC